MDFRPPKWGMPNMPQIYNSTLIIEFRLAVSGGVITQ